MYLILSVRQVCVSHIVFIAKGLSTTRINVLLQNCHEHI